jgi:hypothetical protein
LSSFPDVEKGQNNHYSHVPYDFYKDNFQKAWARYFKFAVVRNPYEKTLSSFRRKSKYEGKTYRSFYRWLSALEENNDPVLYPQTYWTGVDELDLIIKYEELERGLKEVQEKIGIILPVEHLNQGSKNLSAKHTKKTIQIINKHFADDFETFGYEKL